MARYNTGVLYSSGHFWNEPDGPAIVSIPKKGRRYMAGNPIPKHDDALLAMTEDVAD